MKRDIEYYLYRGMDYDMAEYFATDERTILDVVANNDHTLTLSFDNGEIRKYDCHHLLKDGSVFEFLKDINNFKRVYLDDSNVVSWDIDPNIDSNDVWDNKVDLSSDTLYVKSVPQDMGMNEIIDYLVDKRKERGMTQEELGNATNLTQSVIARFEAKKVIPRLDTVLKIINALGCRFYLREEFKN